MTRHVVTCPKCGALISPNLARCRQCKHYLHGTQLEGALLEHLLPGKLAASPGTAIFFLLIIGYYALMVMFAGVESAPGFSFYSTRQLGSTWSLGIWEGEYWRFVTSVFAHGGIIHLAFNLYALTIVGPLIEELFDRKKMMLIFGLSGILSMVISHLFYNTVMGNPYHSSVGASGAVSGLIGACLIGARRRGPEGRQVASVMLQWSAYMALWGFAMPGIDNAAHFGGWLIGAGFAAVMPLGITKSVSAQRALSVIALGLLALMLLCIGLMLANLRGFPAALDRDMRGRQVFRFTYSEPIEFDYSSQGKADENCGEAAKAVMGGAAVSDEHIYDCEYAIRAYPGPRSYLTLIALHQKRGNQARAQQLQRVLARMHGG